MEKELASFQTMFGSIAHISLRAQENLNNIYMEFCAFVSAMGDMSDDQKEAWENIRTRLLKDVSDHYDYKADRGGKKSTKKPRGGGKGK